MTRSLKYLALFICLKSNILFAQGISIGANADISLNTQDGDLFPYEETIEFDLGPIEGAFNLELNGYFTDSEDVPYISRFQGLINMYQTTSPTNSDYRHINANEVLEFVISGLTHTEGYGFSLEGMSARMLANDIIIIETSSGYTDTILGDSDNDRYYVLKNAIPVAPIDTIRIKTLEGRWRLDHLTFALPVTIDENDYLGFLNADEISETNYSVTGFGRYYLHGENSTTNYPDGLVALVVDETGDTIRYEGIYPAEARDFSMDLGILRKGDLVTVLAGVGDSDDPAGWSLQFERKPHYYSTHYPDPDELPNARASAIEDLEIFKFGHPRVFSFRNDYIGQRSHERFYTTVVQSQGAAKKIYKWLGVENNIALHWRTGGHAQGIIDWLALLDFSDKYFYNKEVESKFNVDAYPNVRVPIYWDTPEN